MRPQCLSPFFCRPAGGGCAEHDQIHAKLNSSAAAEDSHHAKTKIDFFLFRKICFFPIMSPRRKGHGLVAGASLAFSFSLVDLVANVN